jgi:hypothetical protein
VGLEEERYEPADWIYMAWDGCRWLAVVLTLLNLSEQWHLRSMRTPRGGVTFGMLLRPAFSILAIVIQGNFIMLFLRSLVGIVTQT